MNNFYSKNLTKLYKIPLVLLWCVTSQYLNMTCSFFATYTGSMHFVSVRKKKKKDWDTLEKVKTLYTAKAVHIFSEYKLLHAVKIWAIAFYSVKQWDFLKVSFFLRAYTKLKEMQLRSEREKRLLFLGSHYTAVYSI